MMEDCAYIVETNSAGETQTLGEWLARFLQPGDVVALAGDLGAGKTTLTQGLARGLGIRETVTSPTFTLINQYRGAGGQVLQHVDCYRLNNAPAEMWDAGISDLIAGDDVVVVEWADRIPNLLPDEYLALHLEYLDEDRRRFCFTGHGLRYQALVAQLKAGREDL